MSDAVFPDNTVLCNFAAINRLDLLETVLRGRGRWTEAVAYEAQKSARYLPALTRLEPAGWLGAPIEIDDERDAEQVERIRRAVFGGTSAEPLRHLGEAQTIYLIKNRAELSGSWWVSDDREAQQLGQRQGLVVRDTFDLMVEAVAMGDVSEQEGFGLMQKMADEGRSLRLPRRSADLRS